MTSSFEFDFGGLRMEQIHPMDWGTASGVVVAVRGDERHDLTLSPWWDNDGSTGEFLSCSCGFRSRQFSGNGAWQAGHDGPPEEHKLDSTHRVIRDAVWDWEVAQLGSVISRDEVEIITGPVEDASAPLTAAITTSVSVKIGGGAK